VAKTSKANGASLFVKLSYPAGALGKQSWLKEVKLTFPKRLAARLTTIQKACVARVFEANPKACPAASQVGTAVLRTPVLPVALRGRVYFVSYGARKFPDVVLVLEGDGVTVMLRGETLISDDVTTATFRDTPDIPLESIEIILPQGPFSEFAAHLPAKAKGSFCGRKLFMPTHLEAQNGLVVDRKTRIGVMGCPKKAKLTPRRREPRKPSRRDARHGHVSHSYRDFSKARNTQVTSG
jgi:hypothetical protein